MQLIDTKISEEHIYNTFQLEGVEILHAGRKLEKDVENYIKEHPEFDAGGNWYLIFDEGDIVHRIVVVGRYE